MKAVVFLRVVDQFLSLFGHVNPVHRNPCFILSTMIKEVVIQGLHINNTANTKVRGKGGVGLLQLPTGLRTNLICFGLLHVTVSQFPFHLLTPTPF